LLGRENSIPGTTGRIALPQRLDTLLPQPILVRPKDGPRNGQFMLVVGGRIKNGLEDGCEYGYEILSFGDLTAFGLEESFQFLFRGQFKLVL
jgi:hypothetical protein